MSYPRPLRSATCHLFCERPFVALIYHPPVAQIVIYHPQQVVWNLFLHHRLDADIPSRGIERIAYVNSDQREESLTLTSSFSCICGDVNHSLDSVHTGRASPEPELVFWETVLPDQKSLKPLDRQDLESCHPGVDEGDGSPFPLLGVMSWGGRGLPFSHPSPGFL